VLEDHGGEVLLGEDDEGFGHGRVPRGCRGRRLRLSTSPLWRCGARGQAEIAEEAARRLA
jgi:hypothetical protein